MGRLPAIACVMVFAASVAYAHAAGAVVPERPSGSSRASGPVVPAARVPDDAALKALDPLVDAQDYGGAFARLEQSATSADARRRWVLRHAERGHVPFMYEVGDSLYKDGDKDEAIVWYGRARFLHGLDSAECAQPGSTNLINLGLSTGSLQDALITRGRDIDAAVVGASEWVDAKTDLPPPDWLCPSSSPSKHRTPEERKAAREEGRRQLLVRANLILDVEKATAAGAARKWPIVESGILGQAWSMAGSWIDDRRLVVAGVRNDPKAPLNSTFGVDFQLLLWDVESGEVRSVGPPGFKAWSTCVFGGRILASVSPTADLPDKPKGSSWIATARADDFEWSLRPGEWDNYRHRTVDCSERIESQHLSPGIFISQRLLPGDGEVESRLVPQRSEAIFIRGDGVEIRLATTASGAEVLHYAPWKRAYLLYGYRRRPGTNEVRRNGDNRIGDEQVLLWLFPSGHVEEVRVPSGHWLAATGMSGFAATRSGLLVAGGGEIRSDFNSAGLYLIGDGRVLRLLSRESVLAGVSPNGCRAAAWSRMESSISAFELIAIDLCAER